MRGQSRREERHLGVFLDGIHLIIGIVIVAMGLLAFVNPRKYIGFFPVVFLLAAVLNGISGIFELKTHKRGNKRKGAGLFHLALCAALAAVGALSAVSLWG